jgi:hypothetical protein
MSSSVLSSPEPTLRALNPQHPSPWPVFVTVCVSAFLVSIDATVLISVGPLSPLSLLVTE